jgi:hypothetical protein
MRLLAAFAALLLSFPNLCAQQVSAPALYTTQSPQRDPQALAVLSQAVAASGGITTLSAIQDFRAAGTITYYWAGEEVQGSVSIRGRGTDQFRLDAELSDGPTSWAVNKGTGSLKRLNSANSPIGFHNSRNLAALTWPIAHILAALSDPSVSVALVQSPAIDGKQVSHVRIQKQLSQTVPPDALIELYATQDYLFDSTTGLLIEVRDRVGANDSVTPSYAHEIHFAEYQTTNGVTVPMSVSEAVEGQKTWSLQLSSVTFNAGLQDADFNL